MDKKPVFWKYHDELGIVFYCPKCSKYIVRLNKCDYCGQELSKEQEQNENRKIKW